LRLEYNDEDDEMSELAHNFNDMLDRLETSFESQSNFISNASHELNTPLTSIIGEADVTLTRIRSTEEYVEALNNILMEAEKLNKKTKALLFLAQTAFNGKALEFKLVRVDQLILDVKETMNRIHPDNKVTIDFSLLPDNPLKLKISGNEQLLHLALSNIVLNAYKYSNNQPVIVSLGMSYDMLIIIVKDTGIGIPENEIKFIYDPFFRASNTTNYEGYGIGLPLTRNIIKIHKGILNVNSTVFKGTTIEIRLPKKYTETD
jgi:signal transduction histidine kinase